MAVRGDAVDDGTHRQPLGRVGVRELKEHTSEVVRRVREDHETVDITFRGEVVARLVPVGGGQPLPDRAARDDWWRREDILRAGEGQGQQGWTQADREAVLARWDAHRELAEEIGAGWPDGLSAVDAVGEGREERW